MQMNRSIHILYAIIIAIMIITMAGTAIAAEKTITDYMGVGKLLGAGEGGKQKITFEDDMPNFNQPIEDKPEAITVDEAGKKVYMGGGVRDQKGTLWYTGNSDTANCSNGVCDFCNGLRARFRFRFTDIDSSPNSITHADGFTFAVVSGQNYDPATGIYRSGGAPAAISMGELLGYAGPGLTSDGQGIVPPKMAVEFDTYPNAAVDICGSDSRNDPNFTSPNFQNHIALMYWGVQDIAGVCPAGGATYPKKSYDDNRHGVGGTGNDPANAGTVSSPSGGLYRNPKVNGNNWLEDNAHHWFRIETTRSTTVNSATGKYDYTTRVWIDCATCNATELDNFLNVRANFLDRNGDIRINKTTDISTADHALFERMLFGFTEAAGQPTSQTSQHIELDNFELAWLCGIECVYTLNPASISYDNNGGTGSFDVTSPSGCPWTATQNTLDSLGQPFTWFTITSSASGVGNGTINYTVAPYNVEAATRTGTVMVAKQIFTVTQIGCNYVIDPTELWYDASGGNGQIDVTSPDGCTWTATKSVGLSWVTITSGSSGTGNGRVHYKVDPVGGTTPRSGTITINGKVHTIWQTGCTYGINPMSASYTTSGGTGSVAVTSQTGCPWTATESLDWVSITSGASGSGNGSVGYTVAANTRSISRSGTITITGGQTFTINQAGVPCTYSINPTSASFTAAAGTGSVAVTAAASDCAWMAVSNAAWITNVTPAGGSGNGTVNYSVTFNGTGSPRTGTMTIAGKTFTVTQAACTYSINPESASFTAAAATGSVAVTSPTGCTWTATEGLSWVSITTGATGSGNGTVNYYVKANPSASPRTGTMTIAGLTFTINQAASSCPGQFWAEYFANQSLTGLPSLTRCEVSPLTWDWGTGSPGIGIPSDHFSARWSGEFQFGEAGGYTFTSRTDDGVRVWVDDILIIDHWVDQGPTVYQATITLTAGAHTVVMEYYENLGGAVAQLRWDACTYSINPTSYAAPAGGTTTAQTVSVTTVTGCPWTAASNDAWITRTAPTGTVTGAGTVTYTVAANTTGSTRTGTMTIAGQTFTVTQVSCSYTLGATSYAAPAGGTTTAQ
ncbi:MAG: BACON domain-containing carbohydrate-binding protein, partial [Deltaproteobacteria bacterium]|nr:BACON domain-containing carbohydrate-binding protein [Deltaproteobacteria bacterium]